MNDQTVNDLRLKINTLDQLLGSGLGIYHQLFLDYKEKSKIEGFDESEYQNTSLVEYFTWIQNCTKMLEALPRFHYQYHFVKPKRPVGICAIGLPEGLSNYKIYLEYQLVALEEIILRLEEDENLALRKAIADKEYQADTLYRITYSSHTREIKVNNFKIAKPDFDRENERCFDYIFNHPNQMITLEELEKVNGEPLKKCLKYVIRDLGFTRDILKVFFVGVTNKKLMFVNPISMQYAFKHELPTLVMK